MPLPGARGPQPVITGHELRANLTSCRAKQKELFGLGPTNACASLVSLPAGPGSPLLRPLGRSRRRPVGLPARRRSHDQPSRRTLLRRALGKFAGEPDGLIVRTCCNGGACRGLRFLALGIKNACGPPAGVTGGRQAGSITAHASHNDALRDGSLSAGSSG